MKLLFSGYVLETAIRYAEEYETRSFSLWRSKIRSGDVSAVLIGYRNQIEKQKILDFIADFEKHSPHMGDPE